LSRWTKLSLLGRAITSMTLARLGQRRFVPAGIGEPQSKAGQVMPTASRPENVQ
jgi:hypothetical protein